MSDQPGTGLAVIDTYVPGLAISLEQARRAFEDLQRVKREILVDGIDFAVVPGADKPSLHKPGAEKLLQFNGLSHRFQRVRATEDWDRLPAPFFAFDYGCTVFKVRMMPDGAVYEHVIAYREGTCNSMESKYRYRYVWRNEIPSEYNADELPRSKNGKKYRIPNDDTASLVNTIMQQAQKRAMVQATLGAVAGSGLFTDDEAADLADGGHLDPGDAEGTDGENPGRPERRRVRRGRRSGGASAPRRTAEPAPTPGANMKSPRVQLAQELGIEVKRLALAPAQVSAMCSVLFRGIRDMHKLRDDQLSAFTDELRKVPTGAKDVARTVFQNTGVDQT